MKVVFVCTGNTCRSPMAEYLFVDLLKKAGKTNIEVSSAGIFPATDLDFPVEAQKALADEGIGVSEHESKPVTSSLVQETDLFLAMESRHSEAIVRQYPEAKNKTHLLKVYSETNKESDGIKDPFGQSADVYKKTLAEIKEALLKLIEKLN